MRWLGILVLAIMPLAQADDSPLSPFETSYSLYVLGAKIGESTRNLVRQDEKTLRFDSTSNTVGVLALFRDDRIYETSIWQWQDQQIRPQRYVYRHEGSKKNRAIDIRFDWQRKIAHSDYRGDKYEFVLRDGLLDISVYQLRLMLDLAKAPPRDIEYTVIDGHKIKPYSLKFSGEETLETALGKLKTFKFVREDDDKRRSVLWCAPDLRYIPVKAEHTEPGGKTVWMEIDTVTGLEPPPKQ